MVVMESWNPNRAFACVGPTGVLFYHCSYRFWDRQVGRVGLVSALCVTRLVLRNPRAAQTPITFFLLHDLLIYRHMFNFVLASD